MATAIGVVSGLLTIFTFADTYFSAPADAESTIQVAVAVDGDAGTENGGGDLPDTRLFNVYGEFLGITADPGSVASGEVGEFSVTQDAAQQAPYSLFSANNDAICIAYATITWPTSEKYWWDGSYGEACGHSWYYSGIYIQESNYRPNCVWIDGNGDQPDTGFQVRWPTFADESLDGSDVSAICQTIDYNVVQDEDPNSIIYDPNPNDKRSLPSSMAARSEPAAASTKSTTRRQQRARALQRRNPGLAQKLVISDVAEHAAKNLCESETSAGPDFLNTAEGYFCSMVEKELFELCNEDATNTPCFDLDTMTLIGGGSNSTAVARSAGASPYTRVQDWRSS